MFPVNFLKQQKWMVNDYVVDFYHSERREYSVKICCGSINISLAVLAFIFMLKEARSMRKYKGVVNRIIPGFVLFFAYKR